ncbi:MAG: aminotransferase class I/II-fold pyridoxal phosphate-dependent enzyme [Gammaproteobacteria bacterium]
MTDRPVHDRASYPPAKLSMTPLFELADLFGRPFAESLFLANSARVTASGRSAIAQALRLLNIGSGDRVLVPAYHCPAMIEPVNWAGAEPLFYPLTETLDVDPDALEKLRDDRCKAVLAAHFFAQGRDMGPLREWCDQHGIALIEDCAHALFSHVNHQPVGQTGDYAIASLWKFLPTGEGGVLYSARHALPDLGLGDGPSDLKALYRLIEEASGKGRWSLLKPTFMLLNKLRGRHSAVEPADGGKPPSSGMPDYSLSDADAFAGAGELVDHLRSTSFDQGKADRRRELFRRIREATESMPGCQAFPLSLDESDVPYVVPLLLEQPERHFPLLKQAGFPVWRWEDLMSDTCPVSNDYRWRLIQLPCQQSLSDAELEWILSTLDQKLRS